MTIIYEGARIGVCAEPHRAHSPNFETGHVLFDNEAVTRAGFTMPLVHKEGYFDQDDFDILAEDGTIRFAGCRFYTYNSVSRTEDGSTTLFENVVIRHEGPHE